MRLYNVDVMPYEYFYSAIMIYRSSKRSSNAPSVLNWITQFNLPPTSFIPARGEQDPEHYIRNELLNVATHFADLGRMEASVKLDLTYSYIAARHYVISYFD